MSAPVKTTYLGRIHTGLCKTFLEALKGEPLVDREGNLVLRPDGQPFMVAPKAATLREIRTFLKDHGIDEEPTETSGIVEVTKAIKHFDDDPDPFLLEHQ